ncbi:DUF6612 family protein [Marinococcus luteus]|uniref:DUF6612 family protein n=1 Tax=Marinococcus luteus TaxID=1122204 RepID=UPI002ACCF9F7|nr:DUF6612 family protein [Marinococcus luteus]MDZ5782579.1 DUF6612 family protein [Marinococcus luteus]
MKKWITGSSAGFLALGVIAVPAQGEEMNAGDVLQQSNETMAELDSYSATTEISQEITNAAGEGETIRNSSTSEQDITMDPFALHQTTNTVDPVSGEEVSTEMYWTEDGYYIEMPDGSWTMMPGDMMGGMEEMTTNPGMHMGASESFADEMDVEETENSYVLTYEGSGEEIEEAASKMMQSDMGSGMADEEMMEETWSMIDIQDVSMSLTVDKDTHYMTASTINLDASYEMEEITTDMNLTADSTYSNFNSVGDITVPEEVMNEAVPMDEMEGMDGMDGMEEMPEEGMSEDGASMEEGAEGGEMPETASAEPAYMAGGLALAGLAGGALLWTRRRQQA